MKKGILIAIIVGMLGWAVYEFASSSGNETVSSDAVETIDEVGIDKGYIAPDFDLTTLDGERVRLSDYRGKRVMLNFWATWCPPCRAEMPDMQKFYEDKDVVVLAVNLIETESNPDNVQDFIDEFGITFTIPLDEGSDVAGQYEIFAYPTSLMIDSNGYIHSKFMGAINYDIMVQQFEMMK